MEHFRRWGLAQRIREVAPLKVEWSQDVVFCTTLLGIAMVESCWWEMPHTSIRLGVDMALTQALATQ
jgi:uncharacterized membrane protein affecting hemolysin expression